MSKALTEWVSAPTDIRSTPVVATAETLSRVMPPEASRMARPPVIRTAAAISSSGHVVKEDDVGPTFKCLLQLVKIGDFHFYLEGVGRFLPRAPDELRERGRVAIEEIQVVVFDEYAVSQVHAVVVAAADAHGIFVQGAESGGGLAGVDNAGAGAIHSLDVFGGLGGYAAHPLQNVEGQPLSSQDDVGGRGDCCDDLAGSERGAVFDEDMSLG